MTSACWGAQDQGRGVVCGLQGTSLDALLVCILCDRVFGKACPHPASGLPPSADRGDPFPGWSLGLQPLRSGVYSSFRAGRLPCTPSPDRRATGEAAAWGWACALFPQLWLCWD